MVNAFLSTPLWGSLLQDAGTAEAYSAPAFTRRMVAFERAWTQALIDRGIASEEAGQSALAAIDRFDPETSDLASGSERDGVPVPALVRALRAGLEEDAAKAIHSGATSQDVLDTAMMLTVLNCLARFEVQLADIIGQIDSLTDDYGQRALMGRTRMQAALPIRVSDRLAAWRAPLSGALTALPMLVARVGVVQAGGAVGTRDAHGDKADEVVAALATHLGLSVSDVWHSDRSRILDVGHWLTKVVGALGKIGQDMALMAQQGVDEVTLSGAGGSSAMPHKQNPVRAEVLIALARVVAGQQGTLAQALVHEQERSGAAWAIEWMTLPAMFEATGVALATADGLLDQVTSIGADED
ncbi:3-carboxy-cis,cis-muconate cycloisomerase [Alphaproteobacteria bacterium GH1-50]|uniref:3-carboxy-cis,cis-muconate cycloisomerase n=1 Tax=Kangsaoukella pontilimi TaxID=2691042 RepID=A0A7C9M9K6_9RHOB|nr:3-carboxy-cis,cis-muconate cycloisomerase [Kangsaoukella pontilimi]MXQ07333.1 3-carboxy-cis,cis-muconate cycloisomerase [Kangsaoukella pontilimi]